MAIDVTAEFPLPASTTAPAFSCDVEPYLGPGGVGFSALQVSILEVMEEFRLRIEIEPTAWLCTIARPDDRFSAPPRAGLLFAYEGEASAVEVGTLLDSLDSDRALWISEGTREIPRRAFPSVAILNGKRYQLWNGGERGLVSTALRIEEGVLVPFDRLAQEADEADFPQGPIHAVATQTRRFLDEVPRVEKLKVAFALNVAERVVEADGQLHEGEMDFIRRVFPPHRLDALGLSDRAAFMELRQQAIDELPKLLPPGERLVLMGLFYRASEADGEVGATDIRVLRKAASLLLLDWDDVQEYLVNLW